MSEAKYRLCYFVGGPKDRQWGYAKNRLYCIAELPVREIVADNSNRDMPMVKIKYHDYLYQGVRRMGKPVMHYMQTTRSW